MTVQGGKFLVEGIAYLGNKSYAPSHLVLGRGASTEDSGKLLNILSKNGIEPQLSTVRTNDGDHRSISFSKPPKEFRGMLEELAQAGLASEENIAILDRMAALEDEKRGQPFNPLTILTNTPFEPIYQKNKDFKVDAGPLKPFVKKFVEGVERNPDQVAALAYLGGDTTGAVSNPIYDHNALKKAGGGEGVFYFSALAATGMYALVPEKHGTKAQSELQRIRTELSMEEGGISAGERIQQGADTVRNRVGLLGNVLNGFSGFGLMMSSFLHRNPLSFAQGTIVTSSFATSVGLEAGGEKFSKPVEAVARAASPITRLLPQSVRDYVSKTWEISKIDTNQPIAYNKNHNFLGFVSIAYQLFNSGRFRKQAEQKYDAASNPAYALVKASTAADGSVKLERSGSWKDIAKDGNALRDHLTILRDGYAHVSPEGRVHPLTDEQRASIRSGSISKTGGALADGSTVLPIPHALAEEGWNKHGKKAEWRYDRKSDTVQYRENGGVSRNLTAEEVKKMKIEPGPAGYNEYFHDMAHYQTAMRDPLALLFRTISTAIYVVANGVLGGIKREANWLDMEELFNSAAMLFAEKVNMPGSTPASQQQFLQNLSEKLSRSIERENETREKFERKERIKTGNDSFTMPRLENLSPAQCADVIAHKLNSFAKEDAAIKRLAEAQLIQHAKPEASASVAGSELTASLQAEADRHHHPVDFTNIADLARQAAAQVVNAPAIAL